jgi:hypothetical protein
MKCFVIPVVTGARVIVRIREIFQSNTGEAVNNFVHKKQLYSETSHIIIEA